MKITISFLNKIHKEHVCNKMLKNLNILYYPSIGKENEFIFKENDKYSVFRYLNDKRICFDIIK